MVKRGKARARHQFLDKRENLDHLFFWYVFIIQSYISVLQSVLSDLGGLDIIS